MNAVLTTISEYFVQSSATVLFLPLWVVLMIFINYSIPFLASKKMTLNLTLGSSFLGFVFAVFSLFYCIKNPQALVENNITWMSTDFQISFGVFVDNLSALMLVFTSLICFVVQLFSFGYMKKDESFHRFYIYLNLFMFCIFGFILASNVIQSYVFLELVGVITYLLIGFWYKKRSATRAARKAFIINRIGDVCLLIGIVVLVYFSVVFNSAQNMVTLSYSTLQFAVETLYSMVSDNAYLAIGVLIFLGIMAKTAQIPMQNWIVGTIEAPAPATALMNSFGIVAVGVYLCARFYPLFILSKSLMGLITFIGIVTALVGAYVAMSQNDLRKILAYSTSSQLGIVFVGLGIGAFSASIFCLVIHGITKALMFLVSGALITALKNESDIRYMGACRKKMPLYAFSFFIGAISLSGALFSGFYSEVSLFNSVLDFGNEFLSFGFLLFVFFSAFYLFRAYFLIFEGDKKDDTSKDFVEWTIKCSIVLLSLIVIFIGYILRGCFGDFIFFISPDKLNYLNLVQNVLLLFVVFGAGFITYQLYMAQNKTYIILKEKALNKSNLPYKLSYNAFYFDKVSDWFAESLFLRLCRFFDFIEKYVIGGIFVVLALTTRVFSYIFSRSQTGNVQSYVTYSLIVLSGVLAVVAVLYILGSLMGV